jgi:hypothetical protein
MDNTRMDEVVKVQEKLLKTKKTKDGTKKPESIAAKLQKQKEKAAQTETAEPVVKRGRGRPRKVPVEA